MPAPVHQHVRQQDAVTGEMHENPFALGFNQFDRSATHSFVEINTRELRKDGFEPSDGLSRQGAVQRARCAKDGIAFRHLSHLRGALFVRVVFLIVERFDNAGDSSHVIASGGVGKPGFLEGTAEWMLPCRKIINVGNQ